MEPDARIYVAGHRGLVGSAICRQLRRAGFRRLVVRGKEELDLRRSEAVEAFFEEERPHYVFHAAGTVGGILANDSRPAEFIYDNLLIQANVIHCAYRYGVRKLLNLGSSCVYPKGAPQPIREAALLDGKLEPTNEAYAVAKIAGIKMCQAYNRQYGTRFVSAMPTNLYGPGDRFDPVRAHVLPALIRRVHEAKLAGAAAVTVWGTGRPRRELLFVEDAADACLMLMERYEGEDIINVGTGVDVTIRELAELVREVVGYPGELRFDPTKPDGVPRKLLDVSRVRACGWTARTSLADGVRRTYEWFRAHVEAAAPVVDEGGA